MKSKILAILSKFEIVLAGLLFLSMLISCGLYLNIKMNGISTRLPSLPEKEKRLIMRSVSGEYTDFEDDLIEPEFVGVKNENVMVAALPDDTARRSIESVIYSSLIQLFSGSSTEISFDNEEARLSFVEEIKNRKEYILISFYTDIPSSAFLPCIVSGVDFESHENVYNIRHLFLLPDSVGNLYAVALSSEKKAFTIIPDEKQSFGKINIETYDVSDGWSYFEYPFYGEALAEISDSVSLSKYQVIPAALVYNKNKEAGWINNCFDVFSVNSNLVKSISFGDNSIITYVDESNELIVDDNGFVEYRALDNIGINLDEYLGYVPGEGFTFSDKIFAVKKIVNSLKIYNDNVSYSFSDFQFDAKSDILKIYFKIFTDGILITDETYDAVFEIHGNNLVYAKYLALISSRTNESVSLIPQKYADVLLRNDEDDFDVFDVYCPVMVDEEITEDTNKHLKSVKWARISSSSEVNK